LWDSDEGSLDIIEYPLQEFIYHCGRSFKVPDVQFGNQYMLVVLDQNDATIALMSGTGKKEILWSAKSYIGGKHKTGGQSAPRMERARQLERKAWFRKIATKMKDIYYAQQKG
jgi:peptide subunit release factor 1 (eRF1)